MTAQQNLFLGLILALTICPTIALAQASDTCDLFLGYEQPLTSASGSLLSDETAPVDGFLEAAEATTVGGVIAPFPDDFITEVRVWGVSVERDALGTFLGNCTDDDATPFNVRVYQDGGGLPGAAALSVVATPVVSGTIGPLNAANVRRYDFAFTPALSVAGATWISFQRQSGNQTPAGNECVFQWVKTNEPGFDGLSAESSGGVWASSTSFGGDLGICIVVDPVPVELMGLSVE